MPKSSTPKFPCHLQITSPINFKSQIPNSVIFKIEIKKEKKFGLIKTIGF